MKSLFLTILITLFSVSAFAQNEDFQLSTHILDVSKGLPAPDVAIRLEKLNTQSKLWIKVDEKITDANGRIPDFLPSAHPNTGIYKLIYLTDDYFRKSKTESFYPFIEVVFEIKDQNHYHVPITLSPYGYSTYRGS
ncbi:5-hydroxyisourate hydrolase [Chryseobacterium sp. Leaf404]|uniref:hydroxyisourate hydrolase n=1 Tax=unclassified Chryseobacterium TaxID=2593645 RepID=UPI0006FAF807|nr:MULTISPECIES: hydroxyisourate hydrolase [unclassified Chryseobacterium]KQT18182.1 5-hydroxyisourate hydrolase [Chryseobacterium sp. Leaf404]